MPKVCIRRHDVKSALRGCPKLRMFPVMRSKSWRVASPNTPRRQSRGRRAVGSRLGGRWREGWEVEGGVGEWWS